MLPSAGSTDVLQGRNFEGKSHHRREGRCGHGRVVKKDFGEELFNTSCTECRLGTDIYEREWVAFCDFGREKVYDVFVGGGDFSAAGHNAAARATISRDEYIKTCCKPMSVFPATM